jgi:hypothetical protein
MHGEVDPRLIGVLQAVMGFSDSLRDAGVGGEVNVRLNREDGLLLLALVSGSSDASAEEWSQRGRPKRPGLNSLKVADVSFEWPAPGSVSESPEAAGLFARRPAALSAAANDNPHEETAALRCYGFEEEQPALR